MIGRTLAQYVIESRLGAGGMGEVYQARDTRLGRSVAVKVLPEAFAKDVDRISRFEREAKLLASLNHENIAALYGLEEFDRGHFLVMELVEGETLAGRIARGPIRPEEALKIALQIAEALEAAHERGVVHRDLKPANVKITPDGKVKVLDFGLAKAMDQSPASGSLSNSPTMSMAATNAGVILGTAAYMSPEQAKGQNVDARSDIFSFGCVLYEMNTGRQPFQGENVAEILAGIIAREPDLTSLPANLNPRVTGLLSRCLEKNPKRRWHAVADVRAEIETILADPQGVLVRAERPVAGEARWKRAIPIALGVVIGAAVTGIAAWTLRPSSSPPLVTRFTLTLPEDQRFTNFGRQVVAVSPDGARLVYGANDRLYLRLMGELESAFIQGTETTGGVMNPVFSPDGQSIAFWSGADRTLKRISVSGGAPVTIGPADPPFGMSWGPDNEIVVGQGASGIVRVSANGGRPEPIVGPENLGGLAHGPQILPGGGAVLFTLATIVGNSMWDRANIVVQSLASGERKVLIEGGTDARYLPTGHIVYALAGNLLAVPFDVRRLEVTGGPVPILEGVAAARAIGIITGTAQFSVSDTGSLVYIPAPSLSAAGVPQRNISLVDRKGVVKSTGLPPGPYGTARISPDGKRLAISTDDPREGVIWIYELSGASSMRRLTFAERGRDNLPVWSEDGARIVFMSTREGDTAIFSQRADGTGAAERLTKPESGVIHLPDAWGPGNDMFSFVVLRGAGDLDVWTHSIGKKASAALLAAPGSIQGNSVFSPDGKWVAYQSNEIGTSGQYEIYVQPYPVTGAKFQITRNGGIAPVWSADGKELFYVNAGRLFSVSIQTRPAFAFSNPALLPVSGFVQPEGLSARQYDITPNGQFVMIFPVDNPATDSAASLQIQVVLNWFEALKQRLGSQ